MIVLNSHVVLNIAVLGGYAGVTQGKETDSWKVRLTSQTIPPKSGVAIYLISHCRTASKRDSLVAGLMKHIDIDSFGRCLHNKEFPLQYRQQEQQKSGYLGRMMSVGAALDRNYSFSIVALNSICEDYCAEKTQRALSEWTIPVYLGAPNIKDWDPGLAGGVHPAIIHIQDFDSFGHLASYMKMLLANRTARERYYEFHEVPLNTWPRHRAQLLAKQEYVTSPDFVCRHLVRPSGAPLRAKPPSKCQGSWREYFQYALSKNMVGWRD